MTNPDDVQRRKNAEDALKFMVDQGRQITPREMEADALLAPVRERHKLGNHYMQEARALLERHGRK